MICGEFATSRYICLQLSVTERGCEGSAGRTITELIRSGGPFVCQPSWASHTTLSAKCEPWKELDTITSYNSNSFHRFFFLSSPRDSIRGVGAPPLPLIFPRAADAWRCRPVLCLLFCYGRERQGRAGLVRIARGMIMGQKRIGKSNCTRTRRKKISKNRPVQQGEGSSFGLFASFFMDLQIYPITLLQHYFGFLIINLSCAPFSVLKLSKLAFACLILLLFWKWLFNLCMGIWSTPKSCWFLFRQLVLVVLVKPAESNSLFDKYISNTEKGL